MEPPARFIRRSVPNDNDCLFSVILYLMEGRVPAGGAAALRQHCAAVIGANPELYSEAVLGMDNAAYRAWKSWKKSTRRSTSCCRTQASPRAAVAAKLAPRAPVRSTSMFTVAGSVSEGADALEKGRSMGAGDAYGANASTL